MSSRVLVKLTPCASTSNPRVQCFLDKLVAIEKLNALRGMAITQAIASGQSLTSDERILDDVIVGRPQNVPTVADLVANRYKKALSQPVSRLALAKVLQRTLAERSVIEVTRPIGVRQISPFGGLGVPRHGDGIPSHILGSRAWHRHINSILDGLVPNVSVVIRPPPPPPPPPTFVNKQVSLDLVQLECKDETGPESSWSNAWTGEAGQDEIRFGAVVTEGKDKTTKVNDYKVGDFEDNTVVRCDPPRTVFTASLDADYSQVKAFTATLCLAEEDNGGFSDFLDQLYQAVKADLDVVFGAIGAAAGTWIGAEIGGTVGTSCAGPIGAVIGAIIGAIVGAIVAWLVDALKDDLFDPQVSYLCLPATDSVFSNGGLVSDDIVACFNKFEGSYELTFRWRLTR